MNSKPGQPAKDPCRTTSDRAAKVDRSDDPPAKADHPAKADATKKPQRPVGEGPDNLRQRAEWFRRRTGAK